MLKGRQTSKWFKAKYSRNNCLKPKTPQVKVKLCCSELDEDFKRTILKSVYYYCLKQLEDFQCVEHEHNNTLT